MVYFGSDNWIIKMDWGGRIGIEVSIGLLKGNQNSIQELC